MKVRQTGALKKSCGERRETVSFPFITESAPPVTENDSLVAEPSKKRKKR
jgi:hypothetical protein